MSALINSTEKIKAGNVASIIIVILAYAYLFTLLLVEIPQTNRDIVNFLSGSMFTTALGGAVYFLFNYKKKTTEEEKTTIKEE